MNSTTIDIRSRVVSLLDGLTEGLYEREEAMKLALLSAIAGESIFLLGPPGVGKSLIARRLKYAFRDGTSFEYLMSKFSTPDEIFGPVSIKKLKEEDKYERITDKYLPGANIVFLDEIWKSGSAIQNALLTILNEKIYRNGEQEIQVDIKAIITASNELPPTRESFSPLWDRLLVRYEMGGIQDKRNFLDMITDTQDVYVDHLSRETKIGQDELANWSATIDQIEVPNEVLNSIQVIRAKIEQENAKPNKETPSLHIYDRRWKKIVRLLRTSAFLNGRSQVDLMDCFLMVHALWGHPSQLNEIQEIVSETIRKHGYSISINLNMLRKEVAQFEQEVEEETRIKRVQAEDRLLPVQDLFYHILQKEKQFQGELIKISEYTNLNTTDFQIVNVFDKDQVLRHRLSMKKSQRAHSIDIVHNSIEYQYDLECHQVEKKEVIYKKPHKLVAAHWNERYDKLLDYIVSQQERLSEDTPEEFAHLRKNVFVPAKMADIVMANLGEVRENLRGLKLRLEKARYAYESL
ncbi:MAG: AAA family ATPase [Bacteroidota bacterium]